MFRTGGSAEGITSGLQPRQKYSLGRTVNPFERTGNLPGGAYNQNVNTPKPNAGMSTMEKIQSQSGLSDFKIVMDSTNNTPDVVDRNILYGQIFVQPTRTAEFIVLDFTIQPTGATFPE